jgi:phage terminase large subunit-like protein
MKTAAMVINEMEVFPKGRYDDLSDSTTQAMTVRAKGTS